MEINVRPGETLGWHFLPKDRHLRYAPYVEIKEGKVLSVNGPVELCVNGLHASEHALDAVSFAQGPIACRVKLSGDIVTAGNQMCARERTVLWVLDATPVLQQYMYWCAEQVLMREREAGREPDHRSWAAVEAKRRALEMGIADNIVSSSNVWAAAWNAAWDATEAREKSPAWYAAWHAAEAAAESVAWHAPWHATKATAEAVASYAAYRAVERAREDADKQQIWHSAREYTWYTLSAELERRLLVLDENTPAEEQEIPFLLEPE